METTAVCKPREYKEYRLKVAKIAFLFFRPEILKYAPIGVQLGRSGLSGTVLRSATP